MCAETFTDQQQRMVLNKRWPRIFAYLYRDKSPFRPSQFNSSPARKCNWEWALPHPLFFMVISYQFVDVGVD